MFWTIWGLSLLFLVISFLMLGYVVGRKMVARRQPDPAQIPSQHGMNFDAVMFESTDGLNLNGWWIPSPTPTQRTIIQCHGQNGSMDADIPLAKLWHAAGFNVLMFNFRAHGDSGGDFVTFGLQEKADLLGAIAYVQRQYKVGKVGVMGLSMGALVALHTATDSPHIACMALDGTTAGLPDTLIYWLMAKGVPAWVARPLGWLAMQMGSIQSGTRLSQAKAMRWAGYVSCPILFIHAANDQFIDTPTLIKLANSTPKHQVWIAPNCRHRDAFLHHPADYRAKVTAWFEQHLPTTTR